MPVTSRAVAWMVAAAFCVSVPLAVSVSGPFTKTFPRLIELVDKVAGPPADIVSSEPVIVVTLDAFAAVIAPVAQSEIGPPVVCRRPFDWTPMLPFVAVTVIERPDPPAITGSVITTSGAVIVISPSTVLAPAKVTGTP